jgi:hypothetical protein
LLQQARADSVQLESDDGWHKGHALKLPAKEMAEGFKCSNRERKRTNDPKNAVAQLIGMYCLLKDYRDFPIIAQCDDGTNNTRNDEYSSDNVSSCGHREVRYGIKALGFLQQRREDRHVTNT